MKSKFRFFVLFVAIVCFTTTSIFAQFSRNDAIDLVLNTILADDIGYVDVYASYNSFTTDVELIDNDSNSNPYTESWVFFSDDNPFASWYHSSRIIYVSSTDGSYTISNVEIYPKGLQTDYEETSLAEHPDPVAMDGTAFMPDPLKVESNYNYALIIVSMDQPRNWYNTSLIYNVLMQNYNYKAENIFVLYSWDGNSYIPPNYNNLDGIEGDDIDGPATWFNIQSAIADLTATLGHDDQLAVFFTGIPVNNSGPEPALVFPVDQYNYVSVVASDVSEPFEDIDCGQMIFTFDVNSASDVSWYFEAANGTDVLCENRYLHASTGSNEKNYAEMYFSGGKYSEQLFYWASAARGWLPDVYGNAPWNVWVEFGQLGLENGGAHYITYIPNHPGDNNLDDDGDNFIQMGEAFGYADDMNTWTVAHCHIPYGQEVPPLNPMQTDEFPFNEDLITLAGITGFITQNQFLPKRSYIVADTLIVSENLTLSFENYSELYIHRNRISSSTPSNAKIIIMMGSSLKFGENMIVANNQEISLSYPRSGFTIYGHVFDIGKQTHFANVNMSSPNGISYLVFNEVTHENGFVNMGNCDSIIIIKSSFTNAFIRCLNTTDAVIDSNIFQKTHIHLTGNFLRATSFIFNRNSCSEICNLMNSSAFSYYFAGFDNYTIKENKITNPLSGINVTNSGWASNNVIGYNTITGSQSYGLFIYSSVAEVVENKIVNSVGHGLTCINNSSVRIVGNSLATEPNETQQIMNSGLEEILTDDHSFPVPLIWNAIYDDNPQQNEILLFCQLPVGSQKEVTYNYWGETFSPDVSFYPPEYYNWYPTFNLNGEEEEKSEAQLLYENGLAELSEANYNDAKSIFKQVVELYPETRYAQSGLKILFSIEKNTLKDYSSLKQYYLSDSAILTDVTLINMGDYLSNNCDIELQNWANSISWFEFRIQSPPSFADSIYAIIDLQNTYLLIEQSGGKSSQYVGSLLQYIPESLEEHIEYSNFLLSLLPLDKSKIQEPVLHNSLKPGKLSQNSPNPFNASTTISYKLDKPAKVSISIFEHTGKIIKRIEQGTQNDGIHSIYINSEGLASGIYYYSLETNGISSDTKKMIVLK